MPGALRSLERKWFDDAVAPDGACAGLAADKYIHHVQTCSDVAKDVRIDLFCDVCVCMRFIRMSASRTDMSADVHVYTLVRSV